MARTVPFMNFPTLSDLETLPFTELSQNIDSSITPDSLARYLWADQAVRRGEATNLPFQVRPHLGYACLAAAKTAEEIGLEPLVVDRFVDQAFCHTSTYDTPTRRARVAVTITAFQLRTVRGITEGKQTDDAAPKLWGQAAENILQKEHEAGSLWDPLATQLNLRRAVYEGTFRNVIQAWRLAVEGIWRAIKSNTAGMASDEQTNFLRQYIGGNISAMILPIALRLAPDAAYTDRLRTRLIFAPADTVLR